MTRLIVQLAGTNGSGKSTPLRELYRMSESKYYINDSTGVAATWLQDMGIVVLGNYENDCGGCDTLTGHGGLARITAVLEQLLNDEILLGIPIVFEGLLVASYVNIHRILDMLRKYDTSYLLIHCNPELEVCLSRIYSRNSGKAINEDSVRGRHSSLRNYIVPKLIGEDVPTIIWNTMCEEDDMVAVFLNLVWDYVGEHGYKRVTEL